MLFKLLGSLTRGRTKAPGPPLPALLAGQAVARARAQQTARDFDGAAATLEAAIAAATAPAAEADLCIEAALCRLRQFRLTDATAWFERARRAAPAHPLVAQLAQYPALLATPLPVTRRPLPPLPEVGAPAAGRGPVTAVYFFLVTPDTTEDERRGYFALIHGSIASLRATLPGARAVLITDRATAVVDEAGFDAVLREDLDPAQLVHARLLALARGLGGALGGDLVLLDPDTVIERDFRGVYALDFDLGFTWRSDFAEAAMDHEPINVGVIFVRAEGLAAAREFFETCLQHFDTVEGTPAMRGFYPGGLRAWRGDQVLPAAVVGWEPFYREVLSGRTDRLQAGDCRVGFFPSAQYNCSSPAQTPHIRHYKGAQKSALLPPVDGPAMKQVGTWWMPAGETHLEHYLAAREGEYQQEHRAISLSFCRQRRVALDVGAHIGLWSRDLAQAFAQVHAFEPLADFRACFLRNVTATNVRLHGFALGRAAGRATMRVAADNSGASHIAAVGDGEVEVRPLDALALPVIDYLKIDVEGFELYVLEGARETLRRCRPVIVLEQKAHSATHFGVEQYAAVEYLKSLGAVVRAQLLDDWVLAWPEEG
jgi:FkbM family methyltransferase